MGDGGGILVMVLGLEEGSHLAPSIFEAPSPDALDADTPSKSNPLSTPVPLFVEFKKHTLSLLDKNWTDVVQPGVPGIQQVP